MNKTNFLKSCCNRILGDFCDNVYYGQCPTGDFPRIEYEFRQLDTSDEFFKYILTLNIYDKNTSEVIDDIADTICNDIGLAIFYTKDYYLKFYKQNDRQKINETDKSVQHIMLSFELRLYKRSE